MFLASSILLVFSDFYPKFLFKILTESQFWLRLYVLVSLKHRNIANWKKRKFFSLHMPSKPSYCLSTRSAQNARVAFISKYTILGQIAGITNMGHTCFLNSLLQSLASSVIFTDWLSRQSEKMKFTSFTSNLASVLQSMVQRIFFSKSYFPCRKKWDHLIVLNFSKFT